jgi:hypothetical protein
MPSKGSDYRNYLILDRRKDKQELEYPQENRLNQECRVESIKKKCKCSQAYPVARERVPIHSLEIQSHFQSPFPKSKSLARKMKRWKIEDLSADLQTDS